ncbi:MAG: S41 family peptidase [Ruminococcus sp.]|jgi:carboxyl-terminal processing protease
MASKKRKNIICFAAGVIVTAAVILGYRFVSGCIADVTGKSVPGSAASEQKIEEICNIIDEQYLFEKEDSNLAESMYAGLLEGLEDPYSCYYTREEYESVSQSNEGHYEGIGVVLMQDADTGAATVAYCYEDGPASKAGVQQGDVISEVNGESVEGMELSEISGMIQESESVISMTIYRESQKQYLEVKVTKEDVEIPSVSHEMKEDKTGYIAINQFTAVTAEQFKEAYQDLQDQGMESLIVDLRDNPGGLLDGVCDTLNSFMPEGLLVYTEDKKGNREEYFSEGETPIEVPLAVLVNENSASAAEIFAGAVQDHNVGTLVGTTTYGKGIVQKTFGLSDGSVIKLTISSYYTPNGENIHGKGIEPDITVEQPEDTQEDVQLQKAMEILRRGN